VSRAPHRPKVTRLFHWADTMEMSIYRTICSWHDELLSLVALQFAYPRSLCIAWSLNFDGVSSAHIVWLRMTATGWNDPTSWLYITRIRHPFGHTPWATRTLVLETTNYITFPTAYRAKCVVSQITDVSDISSTSRVVSTLRSS
jgi:hypothetical protein